jgi:hypothetical protein
MDDIILRCWDLLSTGNELAVRNIVTVLLCVTLYGLFISRDRGQAAWRPCRPGRTPDSVLRHVHS